MSIIFSNGISIDGSSTGAGGTKNYDELENKPSINSVSLEGNKTTEDLDISYDELTDRPAINGVTLTGDLSTEDLNLQIPAATSEDLGIVKPDNTTIVVENGILTATAQEPSAATSETMGIVKPDNTTIIVEDGVITATAQEPSAATSETMGIVKPDNSTIVVNDGVISATAQTPSAATSSTLGIVRPDNNTLNVVDGVLNVANSLTSQISTNAGNINVLRSDKEDKFTAIAPLIKTSEIITDLYNGSYDASTKLVSFNDSAGISRTYNTNYKFTARGGITSDGLGFIPTYGVFVSLSDNPLIYSIATSNAIRTALFIVGKRRSDGGINPKALYGVFSGGFYTSYLPTLSSYSSTEVKFDTSIDGTGTSTSSTLDISDTRGESNSYSIAFQYYALEYGLKYVRLNSPSGGNSNKICKAYSGSGSIPQAIIDGMADCDTMLLMSNSTTPTFGLGSSDVVFTNLTQETYDAAMALSIDPSGQTVLNYLNVEEATASTKGIVQPDNTTITVSNGVISAAVPEVPTATSSTLGIVRPDNSTVSIADGVLSIPIATALAYGLVKPDGTTITIENGVISAGIGISYDDVLEANEGNNE